MAMVYFNRTKKIKNITINYNSRNEGFVKQIENIVIDMAKQMKVDLASPNGNENIKVYLHPSKEYFKKIFGGILVQREKYGAKAQMNVVTTDDGEIHILIENETGSTSLAKLIVSKIFAEFIDSKRLGYVEKTTKEIIDNRDKKEAEIEIEEEAEVDILEEEIEEDVLDEEVKEISDQIEDIIEKKEVVIPDWLEEGWYRYKKGYMNETRSKDLGEYIDTHKVGKVEKMSGKVSVLKEYDREHELKCTKVEYIIETYGIKMLLKFFENPNIKEVFKISSKQFDDDWKQYLKSKYVKKTMEDIESKKELKSVKSKKEDINNKQEINKIIQ